MDNELTALTTIFTEFYYWMTVVLMFLIHVGFCMYEVDIDEKHVTNTIGNDYVVFLRLVDLLGISNWTRYRSVYNDREYWFDFRWWVWS